MINIDFTEKPHIALDFDATLAYRDDNDNSIDRVGAPIPRMVQQVKDWIAKGYKISIFTARVGHDSPFQNAIQIELIREFLQENKLPQFEITAIKRSHFTHFVDDKAIGVRKNSGILEQSVT